MLSAARSERAFALHLLRGRTAVLAVLAVLAAMPSWPQSAGDVTTQGSSAQPSSPQASSPASTPGLGPSRWFNPASAPFIPVPVIAVDPNGGTTLGLLPTWIQTDQHHAIRRIIAPDVLHNNYFGYGMHARVYDYPSADQQWSVVAGIQQRVQRGIDVEYQNGRLRDRRWSINGSLIYDRNGSPRFFGIGNDSSVKAETNYTDAEQLAQVQVGLNLSQAWQLLYTLRARQEDIQPGTLAGIASIGTRFAHIQGLGTGQALRNRVSINYDTRDDLTAPRHGLLWVAYSGLASRSGVFNASLYSEAGVDGRDFWSITPGTVLATHVALRYLPSANRVPFWALSSIGGDQSEIGGQQPLRGFGAGRFYDRDSFSASAELRRTVTSFNAMSTQVDIEVTPFVDLGRVFARASTFPLDRMHTVGGVGFRGIARPFVVGYVDIGYGSEGVAAFTGIYYPF